ncbi:MAG: lytic transglycosylase domain-containing protein [Bacteroidetes bacterium]|nr:lytic transglycosylase domain-containing protein [Fibrella sp.]
MLTDNSFFFKCILLLLTSLSVSSVSAQSPRKSGKSARHSANRPTPIRPATMRAGAGMVQFCGEVVPTQQGAVSQKLATALMNSSGYAQHLDALQRRSAPYFAVIDPILRKHNIPADFRYLPIVESDWKATAVSSAGAVGYWQFMDETARDMGLKVTPELDERQDLVKSTDAACRYLKVLYRNLGSWTLVAAAYNGGVGMIQRKMTRQGHRDYYRLALNDETSYYLYRILAIKELFTNPARYAGSAAGPMAFLDNPYERERAQARRMGWLNDQDTDPVGVPIEPFGTALGGGVPLMDSLLVDLLQRKPASGQVFSGDLEARLLKSGSLRLGQSWAFVVTRDTRIYEDDLKAGDALYAVVDDIDDRGVLYLRVTKAVSVATKEVIPLRLTASNPATGLAGVPLPKAVKPGWVVQFNL